jgi:23S rRNA (uracil1939-C5)-methyltransferase
MARTATTKRLDMNALGFHIPGRFDKILNINHCYLQAEPSNDLRNSINQYAKEQGISYYDVGSIQVRCVTLIIRTSSTGEIMVIVVFAHADEEQVSKLMTFVIQISRR